MDGKEGDTGMPRLLGQEEAEDNPMGRKCSHG